MNYSFWKVMHPHLRNDSLPSFVMAEEWDDHPDFLTCEEARNLIDGSATNQMTMNDTYVIGAGRLHTNVLDPAEPGIAPRPQRRTPNDWCLTPAERRAALRIPAVGEVRRGRGRPRKLTTVLEFPESPFVAWYAGA